MCDARAEVGIHLRPVVVDRALLDEALHPLAQMPDDVADQMVPIGRRHHLAVERAVSASRLADRDFTVRADPSGIPEIDTAATALNHAAQRIGELVDRERAVTAHASHQLRTPLAGLRLGLETALATPGAYYPAAAKQAIASAGRLERTIDELVTLARTRDPESESIDIAALAGELQATARHALASTNRSFRILIDPDVGAPRASAAAVRQVLVVLIDNAIQHGTVISPSMHAKRTPPSP